MQVRSSIDVLHHSSNTVIDGFIDTINDDDEETGRRHHALLDNTRHRDGDDKSPEQIARDLSKRYGGRAAVRYTGDMNEIPQRLLMPSVHDASLWQVRVKVHGYIIVSQSGSDTVLYEAWP